MYHNTRADSFFRVTSVRPSVSFFLFFTKSRSNNNNNNNIFIFIFTSF